MPPLKVNPDGSRHIHIFVRRSPTTMKCIHPLCTTYTNKVDLVDKESVCSICKQEPIILTHAQLKLIKPRCLGCSKSKRAQIVRNVKDKLAEMGIS